MKKRSLIVSLLMIMLLPSGLRAESVSEEQALQMAARFFGMDGSTKGGSSDLTLVYQGTGVQTRGVADAEPPYYVFNRKGGGFVMISGETESAPVLAWSKEDSFGTDPAEMPAHVLEWMRNMESHIENIRAKGITDPSRNPSLWSQLQGREKVKTATEVVYLETPKWNQTAPFNYYCPTNCPSGCVPTAMAEILYFHKWPDAGVGTLPDYTYTDESKVVRHMTGHELGEAYDYSAMPATANSTTELTDGVLGMARLIYDCGIMVKAQYHTSGTGAYSSDVSVALKTYMKYDKSCHYDYKNFVTDTQWISDMKASLDAGYPIFYSAASPDNEGHAFVVDGYDSDDAFHINFGWGGSYNAYYVFPEFSEFTEYHDMVANLKPDEGGVSEDRLIVYETSGLNDEDREPIAGEIQQGVTYYATAYMYNYADQAFTGRIAWALYDHDDNLDCFVSDTTYDASYVEIPYNEEVGYIIDLVLPRAPKVGDKLRFCYNGENNGDWRDAVQYMGQDYQIYLAPSQFVAEVTSMEFDRTSGQIMITTYQDIMWSVTDETGTPVADESCIFDKGVLTIYSKDLPKGTYTVTLAYGDDIKTFTITL